VFAAVAPGDTEKDADALAAKVLKMRLWDDDTGERVSRESNSASHNSIQISRRVSCLTTCILILFPESLFPTLQLYDPAFAILKSSDRHYWKELG